MTLSSPKVTWAQETDKKMEQSDIEKQCRQTVFNMIVAIGNRDYKKLFDCFDNETKDGLQRAVKTKFNGNPKKLMAFLEICDHPGRYSKGVAVTPIEYRDKCMYCRVELTRRYQITLDEIIEPKYENKPVVNWICFKYQDGKYVMHLDFPLHDIIYFLQ